MGVQLANLAHRLTGLKTFVRGALCHYIEVYIAHISAE